MDVGGPAWDAALRSWRRLVKRTDGGAPLDALADVATVRRLLEQVELSAVRSARRQGLSWAEIATNLGVTRQSAWERWRDLDADPAPPEAGTAVEIATDGRVPDVIGLSCADARQILVAAGFRPLVHNAGGRPLVLDEGIDGVVTDQVPKAGSRRRGGSSVTVWYEHGGEAGVREPRRPRPRLRSDAADAVLEATAHDLIGRAVAEAADELPQA